MLATLSHEPLLLNHVLLVPYIAKNLLSVSQLLANNNVIVEFLENFCLLKARNTWTLFLKGISKEVLHQIQDFSSPSPQVSTEVSFTLFCRTITHKPLSMFFTLSSLGQLNSSQVFVKTLSGLNNAVCTPTIMSVSIKSAYVNFFNQRLGKMKLLNKSFLIKKINNYYFP